MFVAENNYPKFMENFGKIFLILKKFHLNFHLAFNFNYCKLEHSENIFLLNKQKNILKNSNSNYWNGKKKSQLSKLHSHK